MNHNVIALEVSNGTTHSKQTTIESMMYMNKYYKLRKGNVPIKITTTSQETRGTTQTLKCRESKCCQL